MTTEIKSHTMLTLAVKSSKGQAMVEFAIVLLVLVPMLFGVIEVGRLLMVKQVLANAARVGAREAALSGSTQTSVNTIITTALTNTVSTGALTGHTVTLTPTDPATAAVGSDVSVSITVPFSQVSWVKMMFQSSTLSGQCTMRKETTSS